MKPATSDTRTWKSATSLEAEPGPKLKFRSKDCSRFGHHILVLASLKTRRIGCELEAALKQPSIGNAA